jgi:hypothetical protein
MRIVFVLALALTTTACPFSDDDGDGSNYVAIGAMPEAYKDAYCTYLARCGLFPDKATCVGAALAVVGTIDPNLVAAVGAGRVLFNGSAVKACFDAVANDTCDQTDENGRVRVPACGQYFKGTVPGGGDCILDEECVSQQCSGGSTGTSCIRGTCIGDTAPVFTPKRLGEPCGSTSQCIDGAYCETAATMPVCVELKQMGVPCTASTECGYGLACAGTTGARVCQPLPAVGQPCPDFLCRDEGTFCNTSTSICTQVGLPTAPCTSSLQCSPYYPCDFATTMCKQGPGLGQSCSSGVRCFAADTYCDSATLTCVGLKADGQPCTAESQCLSDFCDFNAATPVCGQPPVCQF